MKLRFGKHRFFGHKKDKFKDKDFYFTAKPGVTIRDLVNFADYLYTPANQTDSSCVGQTFRSYAKGLAKLFGVPETFSSTWIYNLARWLEGTLTSDEGCYPRDALDMLIKKGFLPESYWPYNGFDTTSPPSKFDPYAAQWPVLTAPDLPQLGFYRVVGGAEGIFQALSDAQDSIDAGTPEFVFVAIGIPWPDKWMDTPDSGLLPLIKLSDSIAGGHMILLYAGDFSKGLLYLQNSWGVDWGVYPLGKTEGDKGCCFIEAENFDIFKQLGGYDAQIVKVKWPTTVPEPTPTPTPIPEPVPTPIQLRARLQGSITGGQSWSTIFDIGFGNLWQRRKK